MLLSALPCAEARLFNRGPKPKGLVNLACLSVCLSIHPFSLLHILSHRYPNEVAKTKNKFNSNDIVKRVLKCEICTCLWGKHLFGYVLDRLSYLRLLGMYEDILKDL